MFLMKKGTGVNIFAKIPYFSPIFFFIFTVNLFKHVHYLGLFLIELLGYEFLIKTSPMKIPCDHHTGRHIL